jgi:hypothetical protein
MDLFRARREIARRGSDHTVADMVNALPLWLQCLFMHDLRIVANGVARQQYYTSRGVIPARVVNDQAAAIPDITLDRPQRFYPHEFNNREDGILPGGRRGRLFNQNEIREGERLWEFPVTLPGRPPYNMVRAGARMEQIENLRNRTARDIMANPPNDPGPFRGIVPALRGRGADPNGRRPPIGVIYHPKGELRRFERARMEPLDGEGRRLLRRHEDDLAVRALGRTGTWPPRDEEGADLATHEVRHEIAPPERRWFQGRRRR